MNTFAISRRLLLQRIAPEELTANTYNEEEVMLLLSEVYIDRLTKSEIKHLKIKPLEKTFRCKFCKSKFKKEVKYLRHFINCKDEFNEGKIEKKFNLKQSQRIKIGIPQLQNEQTLDKLRKKKLKEILANDIDEYNNSEISFMLKNIYNKKLSTIDKQILMI
tara:strand:- start:4944 stop:5429 length:486 start_codon:yes stop_codon:yes gene_type:complete